MIVELAVITVTAGREAEFEAVFPKAIAVLAKSRGYLAHEIRRSRTTPWGFAGLPNLRCGAATWGRSLPPRRWWSTSMRSISKCREDSLGRKRVLAVHGSSGISFATMTCRASGSSMVMLLRPRPTQRAAFQFCKYWLTTWRDSPANRAISS
jgi:hypothetical protein